MEEAFQEPFTVLDVTSGDIVHADSEGLNCDLFGRVEILAEVARRGKVEIAGPSATKEATSRIWIPASEVRVLPLRASARMVRVLPVSPE